MFDILHFNKIKQKSMKKQKIYQYPKIQICCNCNHLFTEYEYTCFCSNKCKKVFFKQSKYKKPRNHKQIKMFHNISLIHK